MRLNLGCGNDVKDGYTNVDFRPVHPGVVVADLSSFPWQWKDETVEEVLMYDFLEHFPYRTTKPMLEEVWRVLKMGGAVEIQVPDFEQCARAILNLTPYICNVCEKPVVEWRASDKKLPPLDNCPNCNVDLNKVAAAGVARLYGGQDYVGNHHHTTFTRMMLVGYLHESGFDDCIFLEDEDDYMRRNWNFKVRAIKVDPWRD